MARARSYLARITLLLLLYPLSTLPYSQSNLAYYLLSNNCLTLVRALASLLSCCHVSCVSDHARRMLSQALSCRSCNVSLFFLGAGEKNRV